jgi:hypothetical protein
VGARALRSAARPVTMLRSFSLSFVSTSPHSENSKVYSSGCDPSFGIEPTSFIAALQRGQEAAGVSSLGSSGGGVVLAAV